MERFANQHREMQEAVERLALPHKTIGEYALSISATMEAAHLAAASLDWSRIGTLWSSAERERDLLVRFTDRLSLRHADLIASLETSEGLLASAPSFVSELPTLGVFVHTGAVRSIRRTSRLRMRRKSAPVRCALALRQKPSSSWKERCRSSAWPSSISTAARRRAPWTGDPTGGRRVGRRCASS